MNKKARLEYISSEIRWLDTALLSDIRTLIKGGSTFKKSDRLGREYGSGNISIPVLICTGLELAAALYTGRTQYNIGKITNYTKYDATQNVKKFVNDFFKSHAKNIPLI